jgi:hypothetical protein
MFLCGLFRPEFHSRYPSWETPALAAGGYQLSHILHSWKSFTAHRFKGILSWAGYVWRHESFDHIIRSAEHLAHFEKYIRNNPIGRK